MMRDLRPALLGLSLALASVPTAATTLPGAPLSPRPGPTPEAWFVLLNDALGGEIGDNPDDFRTQAFYGARRWQNGFVLAFDFSILTHKGSPRPGSDRLGRGRVDELTVTLGRDLLDRGDDPRRWLRWGLGGRFTGDLAGDAIQNGWHDALEIDRVDLPYEEQETTAAVGYLVGGVARRRPFGAFSALAPFVARSRFGPDLEGGLLVTSRGEIQGQLSARLTWTGNDGGAWVGLRQEIRAGDTPNPTAAAVTEREEGSWLTYGASFGAIFFEGGVHLGNDASIGRLGWVWRGELGEDGDTDFFGEVGSTVNSYGWGIQVRWRSPLLRLGRFAERSHFLIDYRFGTVPDVELEDQVLQYQQLAAGVDVELVERRPGFSPVPYLYGALGWRLEEIVDDGERPRFAEQEATAAVAHLGAGVRFYFGHRDPRRPRYAVVAAADGWLPFSAAEAAAPGPRGTLSYLEPEMTLGLRLTVQPRW